MLSNGLAQRDRKIIERFESFPNWEGKYHALIQSGKTMAGLSETEKTEDLKIKGCQSQVWIKADLTPEGRVRLQGDSDALIVRGLVGLLIELFDNSSPAEIVSYQPEFINGLGLANHLSPSRANGLFSMLKQIKYYGLAYQAMS